MPNKIQPGCLAIVIGGHPSHTVNIGKITKVGKFLGIVEGFYDDDRWETQTPMIDTSLDKVYHQSEAFLSRIPEEPEDSFITSEKDMVLEA